MILQKEDIVELESQFLLDDNCLGVERAINEFIHNNPDCYVCYIEH